MTTLLSFVTSGSFGYLLIFILGIFLVGALYYAFQKYSDLKKENALYQYNITQLEQNLKDKQAYVEKMEQISISKSEIVQQLYRENDELNAKLDEITKGVDKQVAKGQDKPSSNILKDTFRKLSGK